MNAKTPGNWQWAVAACGLVVVASMRPSLGEARAYQPAFEMNEEDAERANTNPFALILGEVRATMADLMWVKTERYMHRGVGYAPHIDPSELARTGEASSKSGPAATRGNTRDGHDHEAHATDAGHDEHAHDEHAEAAELVPLIPEAKKDYRGYIGTIHRNVQPYLSPDAPDRHESGDELIPWYRVLTLSNPHHTRGYLTGAWWLMKQGNGNAAALKEAQGFIEEGIGNNRGNFQLLLMRGRILMAQEKYAEAVESFRASAELALKTRPEGGKEDPPRWTSWEEEDFSAAVHFVPALTLMKLHDRAAGEKDLAWARKLLPESERLKNLGKHEAGEN